MANREYLDMLKQGVERWNAWRRANPDVRPDLTQADLIRADLIRADLTVANLSGADLTQAYLTVADLAYADLSGAVLRGADLSGAAIGRTLFTNNDLSRTKGLETVGHASPSSIGVDTLYKSGGKIPEVFLRGCGVPDSLIDYLPSLIGAMEPLQFYSCFISYSTKDEALARRLHADLQSQHVRVWFAIEDLKIGEKSARASMSRFASLTNCSSSSPSMRSRASGSSRRWKAPWRRSAEKTAWCCSPSAWTTRSWRSRVAGPR